jgi:two-component system OmpR family response regulator
MRSVYITTMRLLVVEDEPDLLNGLARALRRAGYATDLSADGEEGLSKALDTDYDAIVLDVMLPQLDGWEVLTRLRQTKHTPVLMLTARSSAKDRVRGLDTGADDYLAKPFDNEELLARLRALIRRAAGQSRPEINLGEVQVNTRSRTVMLAGQPVILTAREYGILEFLALHRGEVVTRTTLYEHLMDENEDTLSNLMDVHVFSLRKKLGRELIITHRAQGFSIKA